MFVLLGAVKRVYVAVENRYSHALRGRPAPAFFGGRSDGFGCIYAHVIAAGIDATFLGVDLELNRTAIANKQWSFQTPEGTRCNAPK